ncbi:retinol-binding protein pinta-like [Schistocerca nitens]|uniref:retinol-binding protein pinta-like n=1 Tax=Schistocerca nitens TaxID=7011 RepID=UPI002117B17F|nr:retinol-binding protein pinta-like [Schistocerca nitens]
MADKVTFKVATEEEIVVVRQRIGTTEDDIRQAVSNLRSWLEAQPHLPHVMADGRLERLYVSCKCSIEKTKKTLDAYYTLKKKFPDIMMNRDPASPEITQLHKQLTVLTVPRMTEDCNRVSYLLNITPDASILNLPQAIKAMLMAVEFILSFDYSVGYIFLVDLKNVTAAHVTKASVRDIWSLETISRKAYSKRIVALHFTNATKIIGMVLSVVYPALPPKLRKRVHIHLPGSETLFEHVPKSFLPNEMGGTAGPAQEMMDAVINSMVDLREWFLEEDRYIADESKRPPENSYKNDYDLFGMDGSFKKLQLD